MTQIFDNLGAYYDLIYQDKDYAGESDYVIQLIKTSSPAAKTIVEFGSGTGKHALLLCEAGFSVLGVEPSSKMLQMAQTHTHPKLSFRNDSLTSFHTVDKYDVATALFHVISYLNKTEELLVSFKNIHQHLNKDGLFIFDVWYTPAVLTQLPEKRVKVMENEELKIVRHANPVNHWNDNIIDVNYDLDIFEKATGQHTSFSETHSMRHFSFPEIEMLARITGFEILRSEEFGTGKETGPETWGVCFVLRKI